MGSVTVCMSTEASIKEESCIAIYLSMVALLKWLNLAN